MQVAKVGWVVITNDIKLLHPQPCVLFNVCQINITADFQLALLHSIQLWHLQTNNLFENLVTEMFHSSQSTCNIVLRIVGIPGCVIL